MAAPITYFPKEGIDEAALHINKLGDSLEDKGIEFYYAILPNKLANVKLDLPEERPKDRIKENKQYMISTLDQQSKVSIIDVSEKIVDNYEQDEINNLFFKTDHH
ncbi:hypothetical protein KHA80_11845 [Anaerobacillus sp. HL2]|nr:hypothetical protein KHA80_11845 [Anaerobacillus sp. HL2]